MARTALTTGSPTADVEPRVAPSPPLGGRSAPTSLCVAVASTSLAAGAIHFAAIGDHFQEAVILGLFFAAMACSQTAWAAWILLTCGRPLLIAGAIGNLAIVAVWVASRTIGVPVGPHPWTPEPVGVADAVATLLELVIVAGSAVLLSDRRRTSRVTHARRAPVVIYGLALAVITSAAIVVGADHSHAEATATHTHGSGASVTETGTVGGPASTTHSGPVHVHLPEHAAGAPDQTQLDTITAAMQRYEGVDAARADGYEQMDGDYPETGAHFGIPEWTEGGAYSITGDVDLSQPEYLMYTKRLTGQWKLVAIAFVADMWRYPEPPTTLVGAHYHEHVWNCIEPEGWTLDEEEYGFVSEAECVAKGNIWSPGGEWMTHVWLIPNPEGIFADVNPTI